MNGSLIGCLRLLSQYICNRPLHLPVISSICNLKMCHAITTLDSLNSVINLSYTNLFLWMYTLKDIGPRRPFSKLSQCNKKLSYVTVIPPWVPVIANHFDATVIIAIAESSNRNWELLPCRIQCILYNLQGKIKNLLYFCIFSAKFRDSCVLTHMHTQALVHKLQVTNLDDEGGFIKPATIQSYWCLLDRYLTAQWKVFLW